MKNPIKKLVAVPGMKQAPVPAVPKAPNAFRVTVVLWICGALLFGVGLYLLLDSFSVGADAAGKAYHSVKDQTSSDVYDKFYQASYDHAEEDYHVSNRASILVDFTRVENQLRVMEVYETDYIVQGDGHADSGLMKLLNQIKDGLEDESVDVWLEISGKGAISINLDAAEFIVDRARETVHIRLPEPALTSLGVENITKRIFDDNGILKKSVSEGTHTILLMLAESQEKLRDRIEGNAYYFERAQDSARRILTQLVRDLNPQYPNLVIEIEFFEITK